MSSTAATAVVIHMRAHYASAHAAYARGVIVLVKKVIETAHGGVVGVNLSEVAIGVLRLEVFMSAQYSLVQGVRVEEPECRHSRPRVLA